jgi:orotate phosphoribosyltransferase
MMFGANWSNVIELLGALLVLLAFWANARGKWGRDTPVYLLVNLAGAVFLGVVALALRRWGFVLLEIAWAGVSLAGLLRATRRGFPQPTIEDIRVTDDRTRLRELMHALALQRGHFVLASGKESRYYLDGRMVTLSPEGAYLTGKLMHAVLQPLGVEAVGGLTMGADPVATAVAVYSFQQGEPMPAFLVRKETKAHGMQKQVEGPVRPGMRVAIVEDTVTTGESSLRAIEAVEAMGCTVVTVLALIDRLEGARERLEAAGYEFRALFTIRDLDLD